MIHLQAALTQIELQLRRFSVPCALIGGLAVSARAEPRTTRDIDLMVAVFGDQEAEELVKNLVANGYRHREDSVLEQMATDRLATVRLESPQTAGATVVDLMFASSGIEGEIVQSAERIPGFAIPIATTGHLIALKILAGRPQDLADLVSLVRVADRTDLNQARDALDLIERRGYDRGKDLQKELTLFLQDNAEQNG